MPPSSISQFVGADLRYAQYGIVVGRYGRGVSGSALANGSGSNLGLLTTPKSFDYARPQPPTLTPTGGGRPITTFFLPTRDNQSATLELGQADLSHAIKGESMLVQALGHNDMIEIDPDNPTFVKMTYMLAWPAQSQESDTDDEAGWENLWLYNVNSLYMGPTSISEGENARTYPQRLIVRKANYRPSGEALAVATQGTVRSAGAHWFSPYIWSLYSALGDGSTDAFVLPYTPIAGADNMKVYVNGTLKTLTTHYTITTGTKTVTFTSGNIPTAGQEIQIFYGTSSVE